MEKCQESSDMIEIIEDADKEFLRVDSSATNYLTTILRSKPDTGKVSQPEKPKREISTTLQRIMNPSCISNCKLYLANVKPKSIFTPAHLRQEETSKEDSLLNKQKQIKHKAIGGATLSPFLNEKTVVQIYINM